MSGINVTLPKSGNGFQFPPTSFEFLGLEFVELDPGRCVLYANAREDHCNPAGVLQGGILTAMLDDAMSIAGCAFYDFEKFVPTMDLKVNFLKPIFPERIRVEGEVVKSGRTAGFLSGRILDGKGVICVTGTATVQVRAFK